MCRIHNDLDLTRPGIKLIVDNKKNVKAEGFSSYQLDMKSIWFAQILIGVDIKRSVLIANYCYFASIPKIGSVKLVKFE